MPLFLRAAVLLARWRNRLTFLALFALTGAAWGATLFGEDYLAVAVGVVFGAFVWAVAVYGPPDDWGGVK